MGILLNKLMEMSCFKDAKLVAGTIENKSIMVEGITIIERPDIADWIKGGELLLTSFYSIDKDLAVQKNLVRKLSEKGAAAIIIKISEFLPEISEQIIELGNQLDFPIIEISGETKYIDIMYPVMGEIFNDQVNRLNYYKECHERFTKLSLKMKGIPAVAMTLEDLVGNPVIIFDNEFNIVAFSHEEYKEINVVDDNIKKLVKQGYPVYGLEVRLKDEEEVYTVIVEPIKVLDHIKVYLAVIENRKTLNDLDFIALESAANTLRLELIKDIAVTEVELKYKGDILDDLINGRIDSIQNIYDRANLLGWNLKRKFIVTLINISNYDNYIKKKRILLKEYIFCLTK